jgi:hypothetical protein
MTQERTDVPMMWVDVRHVDFIPTEGRIEVEALIQTSAHQGQSTKKEMRTFHFKRGDPEPGMEGVDVEFEELAFAIVQRSTRMVQMALGQDPTPLRQ